MADRLFHRVADTGPSPFSFPQTASTRGEGDEQMETEEGRDARGEELVARPPSIMSTASAPAAFATPSSHMRRHTSPEGGAARSEEEQGWVTTYAGGQDDPFLAHDNYDVASELDSAQGEDYSRLAEVVTEALALLDGRALQSPSACGAIHEFLVRLRALDPHGNFAPQCPTSDIALTEIRELRETVTAMREAQEASSRLLQTLIARNTTSADAHATASPVTTPTPPTQPVVERDAPRVATAPAQTTEGSTKAQDVPPGLADARRDTSPPKEVGRHDERRAVFCPASAFGGRLPAPASAEQVRRLNNASYQVRDAINSALRDQAISVMKDPTDTVQVVGVNWTERGNLCAVVCDRFTAPQLLSHAVTVAAAAGLGTSYSAHRDVPIFKAVLCNVPTKKTDGSLFTEAEVLTDLRTHSTAFDSLQLADSAEPARWISTAGVRELKPRSTLLLNFSSARDADTFLAMRRRLYAFGCMCEPGPFQPRDRDRICTRCWNPQMRHRERDFVCRERCRLCGGEHIEEDHTCPECDVLAKPCEHRKLHCVNCSLEHAADDSTCEYRRRTRGVAQSAPPMSSRTSARESTKPAKTTKTASKRKPKNTVRILAPHESFPDDPPALPGASDPPQATPPPPAAVHSPAPLVSASTTLGTSPPAVPSVQQKDGARPARGAAHADPNGPQGTVQEATQQQTEEGGEAELDGAEKAALNNLLGASNMRDGLAATQDQPAAAAESSDTSRRVSSTRIAAAEAAREEKRRRAAHVLVRNFKFLSHPDAVAALKQRMDDYVSTVSWAAEERTRRSKPGMQGKTESGLRKIVEEMNRSSADQPHATSSANRTNTTPVAVNA